MESSKNNKKVSYVVLGLAVLLLAFTYGGVFNKKIDRVTEEKNVAQIVAVGDMTKCDGINYMSSDGIDYKIVCKNNIALKKAQETKDMTWCAQLDDHLFLKKDCEDMITNLK